MKTNPFRRLVVTVSLFLMVGSGEMVVESFPAQFGKRVISREALRQVVFAQLRSMGINRVKMLNVMILNGATCHDIDLLSYGDYCKLRNAKMAA